MLIDKELIHKAKGKLGDKNAAVIAEILKLDKYDEKNHKSCCPYHEENTPSFIYNPKSFSFHCFGCRKNVDIIDALMESGNSYTEAVEKLFDLAGINFSFGEHKVKTKVQYRYPKEVPCTDKSKVYEYFGKRKISKETLDYADVRQDEHGNAVFNYYDTNDVLTLVKYRPARKINKGEPKCWCQKDADTSHILFNMNRINVDKPLLICEGEADSLSAIESGYGNAVSVPLGAGNCHWIEENWDWLEQFDSIIICSDNDEAGIKMQKEAIYRLGSWRTKVVVIPPYYENSKGEKIRVKDFNEVLYYFGKEKVIELILNAKDTPVDSVKDLSDVIDVDLDSIDGIYTGINGIDRELMKLFYGTLTVVSGMPGAGKTSFLYQIICKALDQNKNCWLFSKELPEWMTKNWFNYIFAGRRNICQYNDENGAVYYKVSKTAKAAINDYYRGRWFVCRDDYSSKTNDLLQSMEDVVRKYGVKLLVLDNLMTIDMDATEKDELRKQTEVINKLIAFATKFNVAIILVAHPRKLTSSSKGVPEVGIYDISGSSNIINLAHRTIGLRRITDTEKNGVPRSNGKGWQTEPDPYDVAFTVIKDRIRGRAGFRYGMFYDIPSRRFYSNPEEFGYNYAWDKKEYTDTLEYPEHGQNESEIFGKKDV